MIERMRLQEVRQVVLTMPEGAIIPGQDFQPGEPVMIINNPALSNLSFLSKTVNNNDDQGSISKSEITTALDFRINEGTVLYALWSYIYGTTEQTGQPITIHGNETLEANANGYITLGAKPEMTTYANHFYVYKVVGTEHQRVKAEDYEICVNETGTQYYIHIPDSTEGEIYFVSYDYQVEPLMVSHVKQLHNNIFCGLDIYIDGVDLQTDEKRTVYVHCDKVQVDTNMVLSVNNSQKASFTPIMIKSVSDGPAVDRNVATVVVI